MSTILVKILNDEDGERRQRMRDSAKEHGTTLHAILRGTALAVEDGSYFEQHIPPVPLIYARDVATPNRTHLKVSDPTPKEKMTAAAQPDGENGEYELTLICDACARLLPMESKERFDKRVNKPCHTNGCKGMMRGKTKMNA